MVSILLGPVVGTVSKIFMRFETAYVFQMNFINTRIN